MSQTDVDPTAAPGRAILDLHTAINDLRTEIRTDRARSEHSTLRLEGAISDLRTDIREDRNRVDQTSLRLEAAIIDLRTEIREDRGHNQQTTTRLETAIGELRGEIGGVRTAIGELRGEVGGIHTAIGELRGEIGGLRIEMREDRKVSERVTSNLTEAITELRVAVGRLDEQLKASNFTLDQRIDAGFWKNFVIAIGASSAIAGAVAAVIALLVS